jgi:uncharacterized protein
MHINLKSKAAWLQLLVFGGLTIAISAVVMTVGLQVVLYANHMNPSVMANFKTEDYGRPEYAGFAKGMVVVNFFGFFLLPSLIFAWLADHSPLTFAGLRKPARSKFIFLGILVILFSYLSVEWLALVNQELVDHLLPKSARLWIAKGESDIGGAEQNILNMRSTADLLVSVFLMGLLAAVGEELFFRGILQRIFILMFKSPAWGILVTAAIFSAMHGQFLGFIPRMLLGIVLGLLYWYSGSLYPAIIGHFVFNSLQILLVYFKVIDAEQATAVPSRLLLISGILSCIAVWALLRYLRNQSTTTYAGVYASPSLEAGEAQIIGPHPQE